MHKKNLKKALNLKKKVISNLTVLEHIGGVGGNGHTNSCTCPAQCSGEAPSKHNAASICVCL